MSNETNPLLTFGEHRGKRVSEAPTGYIRWLSTRVPKAQGPLTAAHVESAQILMAKINRDDERRKSAKFILAGHADIGRGRKYIIKLDGDAPRYHPELDLTVHDSLNAALAAIDATYPKTGDPNDGFRDTPDPEDDLILVWEVLETGHSKVVWQFCGWHHTLANHSVNQGALPGDDKALYALAMDDC